MKRTAEELEKINIELYKKNLELKSIVEAIDFSSPTLIINPDRRISSVNKIFLFLSGLNKTEIIGKLHTECFSLSDEREYNILWEMLSSGEIIEKEEVFRLNDTELYFSFIYRPVFDLNGKLDFVSCIGTNLTESKRLENEIKQQIEIIKNKNLYINQSIKYAETIQRSMLLDEEILRNEFHAELIYYPRDIVSGDFYWATKIDEHKKIMATVDCTGHGVPGAFLTFIGSKSLDEIVMRNQIYDPKSILNALNHHVKENLKQKHSNNRDGMDVTLCLIEEKENGNVKLIYCGAKLPLFYYRKSDHSVNYIKGSRKALGGYYYDDLEFEQHELTLEKGDLLYLTSDGYFDQYSLIHKRFGKERFKSMIKQVGHYPIIKQREIMEEVFHKFVSDDSQKDDVTVLIVQL